MGGNQVAAAFGALAVAAPLSVALFRRWRTQRRRARVKRLYSAYDSWLWQANAKAKASGDHSQMDEWRAADRARYHELLAVYGISGEEAKHLLAGTSRSLGIAELVAGALFGIPAALLALH